MAADFDFSDLTKLAADLGEAPKSLGPFLRGALTKTATDVKKAAAKSVGSSELWKGAAGAIDYDVVANPGDLASTLTVEVGYNKDKPAGALGNLREFGAPNATYGGKSVPLGPHNDLLTALEASAPDFEVGIAKATEDALRKVGL
jgi:hypothetical protein